MALTLGDNFSYQGAKPLDARLVYSTVASMKAVADSTMYDGCLAYCTATDKTYQWKSTNAVDETTGKWREFTSGGGSSVVSGYYKEADHLFYEESTYTTPIAGAANTIYISVDTNKSYRYNSSIFVRIDEEEGQVVQIATLPTASASNLGKIYEYVGATTQDYTNGVFYKCVFDDTNYSWAVVDVVDTLSASDVTDVKNAFAVQTYVNRGIVIDKRGTEYVVGTCIDENGVEQKLYQKSVIVSLSSMNANEVKQYVLDSDLSHRIENLVGCYILYSSGFREVVPFTTFDGNTCKMQARTFYSASSGISFQIRTGSNASLESNCKLHATFQYTKTV